MFSRDAGLLQGTVELLVLKRLSWGPMHGYGIASWIETATDDVLRAALDVLRERLPRYPPDLEARRDRRAREPRPARRRRAPTSSTRRRRGHRACRGEADS